MSHLSPSEFIDLAEGALDPRRAAHAAVCDRCRARAAVIHGALDSAGACGEVPEPSPLFWEQFSARVRDAVAAPPALTFRVRWPALRPVTAALALAVAIFSVVLVMHDPESAVRPRAATTALPPGDAANGDPHDQDAALDPEDAEAWDVLTAAAADLKLDEAHAAGLAVPAAAVDRAVQRLNAAERTELGRLLQSELKTPQ